MNALVMLDASRWPAAGDHLPGLAGHFRRAIGAGSPAEVVVVDGSAQGWAETAERAASTAAAVLVVDPTLGVGSAAAKELEQLVECAWSAGCALIVGDAWVSASSIAALRGEWVGISDDAVVLVDLAATGESRLPRLLAVLQAGLGTLPALVSVDSRADAVLASARTESSAPVMIRGIDAEGESGCTVTIVLREGALTWTLPRRGDAAPGTIQLSGPEGTRLLPTFYSSPYREALLRAHAAALATGTPPVDEVSPLLVVQRHVGAELRRLQSRPPMPTSLTACPTGKRTP